MHDPGRGWGALLRWVGVEDEWDSRGRPLRFLTKAGTSITDKPREEAGRPQAVREAHPQRWGGVVGTRGVVSD